MPFTAEELEEMRRADEEIERDFRLTREDFEREKAFAREVRLERMLPEERKAAEKQRSYREANREAIAEYQRSYREANREAIAEKQRSYREANREAIAEYQRSYYEANREAIAEYQRSYYEANREAIAEKHRSYYEANREAIAEKQRWIRDERKRLGYTQKDVARLLGVAYQTIGALETSRLRLDKFHKKDEMLKLLGGEKECIDAI